MTESAPLSLLMDLKCILYTSLLSGFTKHKRASASQQCLSSYTFQKGLS